MSAVWPTGGVRLDKVTGCEVTAVISGINAGDYFVAFRGGGNFRYGCPIPPIARRVLVVSKQSSDSDNNNDDNSL